MIYVSQLTHVSRAGVLLFLLVGCLKVETLICFTRVVQIATYVYKIRVYTSCLAGVEELGTLMVYCFPKWCIFDGGYH